MFASNLDELAVRAGLPLEAYEFQLEAIAVTKDDARWLEDVALKGGKTTLRIRGKDCFGIYTV